MPRASPQSLTNQSKNMIDINKAYQTSDGRSVTLYCTDAPGPYPVHGRVSSPDGNSVKSWKADGRYLVEGRQSQLDLVELVPTQRSRLDKAKATIALYHSLCAACEKAEEAGCLDIDGQLYEAIWHSFEGMVEMLDIPGLSWWIWENGCGEFQLEREGHSTLEDIIKQ